MPLQARPSRYTGTESMACSYVATPLPLAGHAHLCLPAMISAVNAHDQSSVYSSFRQRSSCISAFSTHHDHPKLVTVRTRRVTVYGGGYFVLGCTVRLFDGRRAIEPPSLLADSREAGARTGAVEEEIQVAVCHPSSSRAPEHAQHYIEDRVGEGVVDASCGEEVIEQDLDALPARSSYES